MRDFDNMVTETVAEPFQVAGEVFTPRRKVPMRPYTRILEQLGRARTREENEAALDAFFSFALVREDRERFLSLLNSEDEDRCLTLAQSRSITEWLSEKMSGKANESDSLSSTGPDETGASSNVVSLSAKAANAG